MKLKKIRAIILAIMMLSMVGLAYADGEAELTNGEIGGFTSADSPVVQSKSIKIAKEITAYNVDEETIQAPTISYTYTITAGEPGKSITDSATDHNPAAALTRTTLMGVTDKVSMSNNGIIAWTTGDTLNAAPEGAANYKYLTIDFSKVVFRKPGIYRYVINEALTSGSYAQSGVTENSVATNPVTHTHTRYLDVYVKRSDNYTNGSSENDWDIYGYVCMIDNEDITPDGDTTTKGAVKTNGFTSTTNDGTATSADSYYTFNVTVSKNLTGDAYSNGHQFPIHVDFTNSVVTNNTLLLAKTNGNVTDYTHNAAPASNLDGLAKIATGGSIKYIGIPCGTAVTVYETNDVIGTTYEATLTVDDTAGTTKAIIDTSTPSAFSAYSEHVYNSLTGTVSTTANQNDKTTGYHTITISNEFTVISPTGYISRFAPYALLLAGGIVLLVISRKHKKSDSEDE